MHAFRVQDLLDNKQIRSSLRNTIEVAEKCKDFRINKQDIYLPVVPGYENISCDDFLRDICEKRLRDLTVTNNWSRNKVKLYRDRIEEEWKLINSKKFASYFMVVWELVQWCKSNDIMVGPGRGSAGGSLVLFLIGVTSVDPVKYNLLFSRFIAEDRIDYPDIDLDFEDKKRHLIREHLESLYGKNNVTSISTFLTMKGRAAIRDVARVYDIPLNEVDAFAKIIEDSNEENGITTAAKSEAGRFFFNRYPEIVEIATKLEGQIRGSGQHAAGIIISADDLTKGTKGNLAVRSGLVVSNWNMSDSEYIGLMKLDVLGLNTLSILNETKRLAKENGKEITFNDIPLDDKNVFTEISSGHTVGVFQLSAWPTTKLAKEIKCRSINDISDIIALVRPGAFNSGMTGNYIKRKFGEKWTKKHPLYEDILKDTYGIYCYQEQVMEIINKVAGLPYTIADKIRKIIGKKRDAKEFKPFEEAFINGCLKTGTLTENEAKEFWVGLQESADYLFNRSHSIEYAIVGYWTAYCKYYFPAEFICASLTFGADGKKEEIIREAYRLGINIILPKKESSNPIKWIVKNNHLYIPFVEIKGIGEKTASQPLEKVKKEAEKNPSLLQKAKPMTGFFKKEFVVQNTEKKEKEEKKSKLLKILEEIEACEIAGDQQKLASYFSFNIKVQKESLLVRDKNAIQQIKKKVTLPELDKCYACHLGGECEYGPVPPSVGKYNIMIVGEAPGIDEDREGKPFIGKAGQLLWEELSRYRLYREDFYISNICKCYPKITRTPTGEHIDKCNFWLDKEIDQVKPSLILAFGNTGLKGFQSKYKKITDANEKVEINHAYNTEICWCIHPSAVLHNPSNKDLFERGIQKFTERYLKLNQEK